MKSQNSNDCFNSRKGELSCKESGIKHLIFSVRSFLSLLFLCTASGAWCTDPPEKISFTYESSMIGIGKTSVYDTYLSPLKYKGAGLNLIHEQIKMAGLRNENILAQHLFYIELADTKNPTETAASYLGSLEYAYGLLYRFKPVQKIQFFTGLQFDGLVGGIYNTRNGNNPVTAKIHLNLNLSGMAAYRIQIKKQPIRLRYQLIFPIAGVQFSPEFGQSYYEIGLGANNPLLHWASFHNQFMIRSLFSVELPLPFCTLKLAYMNAVYETQINSLNTQILSNAFCIGFSKDIFSISGQKNKKNFQTIFD
ncbi:MAG: DUF3316 domain-containing protein [Dysgonamonadaceae bacterium]|jgi:hypothetical protein|nr:DUF3316 domain-containing protein [Dysgonamonadaceae bacterium]